MSLRVAAVIPNWNGAGRLQRCLDSLAAQKFPFEQVVVVDNGSTDGSEELATIRLDRNYGFSAAVNRGITEAVGADWIAILNNDVVLSPRWLKSLLDDAPAESGMLTGRTLQMGNPKLLDGVGDALSLGMAAARLGYGDADGPRYAQPREVFGVC